VPRFTSISKGEYICPEFGGLPDTVRHMAGIGDSVVLIDTEVNLYRSSRKSWEAAVETAQYITDDLRLIKEAYRNAVMDYRRFRADFKKRLNGEGDFPGNRDCRSKEDMRQAGRNEIKIAVIGHSYNIYDRYINMDMLDKLENMGARTITVEMADEADINKWADSLRKPIFWNYGRKALGSSLSFIRDTGLDGIIYVMSFGCGIDSFVSDMTARRARLCGNIPFIIVTIDEHSGEAGLNTRLEAFIDMIRWNKENENYISSPG
jgi:predicted nucleotide-binding protein (sugar kinase/HSP70/actin superfamily)